jgi:hypothetical protein
MGLSEGKPIRAAVRSAPADTTRYQQVFSDVLAWCAANDFKGYDPYDGCNTRHRWLLANQHVRLGLTYLHKFSPVNLRPLLGVRKSTNVYALALITSAVLRRQGNAPSRQLVQRHVDQILRRSLVERYGHHCWNGNGIPIQTRQGYNPPTAPGIIGTEACGRALLDYYLIWPDPTIAEVLLSVRAFCLEMLLEDRGDVVFFRYQPTTPPYRVTFNASIKALAFVADIERVFGLDASKELLRRALRFLLSYQKPDGSWNYSVDLRTGVERKQIDFHQGFMLDGVLDYMETAGSTTELEQAYRKGLAFYRDHQFTRNGRCLYRYPRRWPANIHNQAQGIITFARWARHEPSAAEFAFTIADWTVREMYDERGFFHYLKYPLFNNRIPFIRWAQAWMLYALAHLLTLDGRSARQHLQADVRHLGTRPSISAQGADR